MKKPWQKWFSRSSSATTGPSAADSGEKPAVLSAGEDSAQSPGESPVASPLTPDHEPSEKPRKRSGQPKADAAVTDDAPIPEIDADAAQATGAASNRSRRQNRARAVAVAVGGRTKRLLAPIAAAVRRVFGGVASAAKRCTRRIASGLRRVLSAVRRGAARVFAPVGRAVSCAARAVWSPFRRAAAHLAHRFPMIRKGADSARKLAARFAASRSVRATLSWTCKHWRRLLGFAAVAGVAWILWASYPSIEARYNQLRAEGLEASLVLDDSSLYTDKTIRLSGIYGLDQSYLQGNIRFYPRYKFDVVPTEEAGEYDVVLKTSTFMSDIRFDLQQPFTGTLISRVFNHRLTVRAYGTYIAVSGKFVFEFSEPVSVEEAGKYIEVDPKIPYNITRSGQDITIEPTEQLEYGKEYRVFVSGELKSENGTALRDGFVEYFKTDPRRYTFEAASPASIMLHAGNPLEVKYRFTGSSSVPCLVTAYAFANLADYHERAAQLVKPGANLSSLQSVSRVNCIFSAGDNAASLHNLPQGGYIVEARVRNFEDDTYQTVRTAVFISDLAVYMQTAGREILAWINDGRTGKPLRGYTVEFYKPDNTPLLQLKPTDARGISSTDAAALGQTYNSQKDELPFAIRNSADELVYVDNTKMLNRGFQPLENQFASFLYIDRTVYRPTDEINFWGYVAPLTPDGLARPKTIKLLVEEANLALEVPVRADGTFTGVLPYQQIKDNWYSIEAEIEVANRSTGAGERKVVATKGFSIREFVKPEIKLTTKVDKAYYNYDEVVILTVKAEYYDGAPAAGIDVEVFLDYSDDGVKLTTEVDGTVSLQFKASSGPEYEAAIPVVSSYYSVRCTDYGESVRTYGYYPVVVSDLLLEYARTVEAGGNITAKLEAHDIDLKNITAEEIQTLLENRYNYYSGEVQPNVQLILEKMRGAAVSGKIEGDFDVRYFENGTRESAKQNFSAELADGSAALPNILTKPFDPRYNVYGYIDIVKVGAQSTKYRLYLDNDRPYYYGGEEIDLSEYHPYAVELLDAKGQALNPLYGYYSWDFAAENSDQLFVRLKKNDAKIKNGGALLFTVITDAGTEIYTTADDVWRHVVQAKRGQYYTISSAYFDGQQTFALQEICINLLLSPQTLQVALSADKAVYRPGDTVNLQIKITDANGRGVAAKGCIGVVDEKIFALSGQYIDVPYDLIPYNRYVNLTTYCTTPPPYYGQGGGGGGGGGGEEPDDLRDNFKDTAFFMPITTGANGTASLRFKLPDNATQWRITGVALTDRLQGGSGKIKIKATLPVVVRPLLATKFIEGDDVAMLLTSTVEGDAAARVDYTVTVKGQGVNKTLTATDTATARPELNFGKLPRGQYTATIRARSGGQSDAVALPFDVIESNTELVVSKPIDLSEPLGIDPSRYPVTLTVYDKANAPYFASVASLFGHYCQRADQRSSRFVAKRAFSAAAAGLQVPSYIQNGNDSLSDMQNPDGGIGLYPDRASDPLITLKMALIAPDQFDMNAMAAYFEELELTYEKTSNGKSATYQWGLAASGRSDIEELRQQLAVKDLAFESKVMLIGALATAGQRDEALAWYTKEVAAQVKIAADGSASAFVSGQDHTPLVWMLTSVLKLPEADAIAQHYAHGWRIGTLYECMVYVSHYDKQLAPLQFQYTMGGKNYTARLDFTGQKTFVLQKNDLADFKLLSPPADFAAMAYYVGQPSEIDLPKNDNVEISKTYADKGNGLFQVTISVKFKQNALKGDYDISDWIPSNMRFVSLDSTGYQWVYPRRAGQRMTYTIYNSYNTEITIRYTVNRVLRAESISDAIYIVHQDTGENASTLRTVIK